MKHLGAGNLWLHVVTSYSHRRALPPKESIVHSDLRAQGARSGLRFSQRPEVWHLP